MEELKEKKGNIKKVYGNENLKEILTDMLEKTFIKEIKNLENIKK